MTPPAPTCPRCGAVQVRCTGCGTSHGYGHPIGCVAASCRSAAAPAVCRCGTVQAPAS